ncbi:uncharacterized protein LOC120335574 [Styela clava]
MAVLNQYLFLLMSCMYHANRGEDCPGCIDIPCTNFPCSVNELCYLKKVSCGSELCLIDLPDCIDSSKVCKDVYPVFDDIGGVVTCESSCEGSQECIGGFCCNSTFPVYKELPDLDFIDDDINLETDGDKPPSFLLPDLYENSDKNEKPSCSPCMTPMCQMLMVECPTHKNAHCVQDNCSCAFWFEDSHGQMVDCLESLDPNIPSDSSVTSTKSPAITPIFHNDTPKDEPVKSTKSPTVTLKSHSDSPKDDPVKSTKSPAVTLKSHNDPPKDDAWKFILIAICGAAVLCFIAFIAYKMAIRRKKQQQDALNQEEQKVPLSQVVSTSPDNNNEFKSTTPIVNSNHDKATSSGVEKV